MKRNSDVIATRLFTCARVSERNIPLTRTRNICPSWSMFIGRNSNNLVVSCHFLVASTRLFFFSLFSRILPTKTYAFAYALIIQMCVGHSVRKKEIKMSERRKRPSRSHCPIEPRSFWGTCEKEWTKGK